MKNLTSLTLLSVIFMCSCETKEPVEIVPGVSLQIAELRKSAYTDIQYDLFLNIPEAKSDLIQGSLILRFNHLGRPSQDLILDYNVDYSLVSEVNLLGFEEGIKWEKEHLSIEKSLLKEGSNEFTIEFIAGDLSLNRNEDYLYTLFVPDRASTAFPCFDQPDLKARFTLSLEIPESWVAVTNYSLKDSIINDIRKTLFFNQTAPLPTYLFAFAIGDFKVAKSSNTSRPMTMYYRETDSVKIEQNVEEIFRLHQESISWMEEYTNIDYPFEKFDFVLLPPFQYGGMEHPGSIFYRERSLFLDEAATLNDRLGRASLIAHETAHIWFGDLVTMKWFNDVWSKEVFANFMADKIVNPSFPEINHDLKFLLRHFPSAYSVDRTKGANAIRQNLENLKNAGLMYGPIIYNKAPVMMKHLEQLTGKEAFREGMREYLGRYSFDNADWNDLIRILDQKVKTDLQLWSKIWIEEPGMPTYSIGAAGNKTRLVQEDLIRQNRIWMQNLNVTTDSMAKELYFDVTMQKLDIPSDFKFALINGQGMEYGSFILDERSIHFFMENTYSFEDEFFRGRIILDLYETFLAGRVDPVQYFSYLLESVQTESDAQILIRLLSQLRSVFWKFLTATERSQFERMLESALMTQISERDNLSIKVSLYRTLVNVFQSEVVWDELFEVWKDQAGFMGIPLSSRDYTSLAMELAVRIDDHEKYSLLMEGQLSQLSNPDDKDRLVFIMPSLDPDQDVRDSFFTSLKDPSNREQEPWVLTALGFLHHPLRQETSLAYIEPSLEMIGEIQLTGDIFFPGRWLNVTLGGHQSQVALDIVDSFMRSETANSLNEKLKLKVLVASDMLTRSVEMRRTDTEVL